MKRLIAIVGMFGCVSALALAALPKARAEGKCGESGQPSCPLQGWMETHMDTAIDKGDMKALAAAYNELATMAPDPKWNEGESSWSKISKAGAEAATKGDTAAAKAQCKTCHKAWRKEYKDSFRTKPVAK